MMKWRVRKDSHCNSNEHEDIRRSLEVLDNVLAEFDDCLDTWDSSPDLKGSFAPSFKQIDRCDINSNGWISNGHSTSPVGFCYNNLPTEGITSHNSSDCVQEQPKVNSPPPIPKRNPSTRLSDRILNPFPFDEASLDKCGDSDNAILSDSECEISALSLTGADDVARNYKHSTDSTCLERCDNCGRALKVPQMAENQNEYSPFFQRKQIFEDKIAEAIASKSLPATKSYNGSSSSFIRRKKVSVVDSFSEPTSLQLDVSSRNGLDSGIVSKSMDDLFSTSESSGTTNRCQIEGCDCRDRKRRLDEKFSETRRLLKMNKIKGLDKKPPSFLPPLPVENGRENRLEFSSDLIRWKSSLPKSSEGHEKLHKLSVNISRNNNGICDNDSSYAADISNNCVTSQRSFNLSTDKSESEGSPKLCQRCTVRLSGTIEDLPNLLPTDALNRPHLGLSYSLEDDLSPGVKELRPEFNTSYQNVLRTKEESNSSNTVEIQKTSTPKSDISSTSLFRTKDLTLSPAVKEAQKTIQASKSNNSPTNLLKTNEESIVSSIVNEIHQTSVSKSDINLFTTKEEFTSVNELCPTSPKCDVNLSRTKEESNLSTFSHSASSSLGYVSSQSDLELNTVPDKVPISSFKSMTLPNGLERSPFYSPVDEVTTDERIQHDHNDNRLSLNAKSTEDLLLRSASAPPPPEEQKVKKKHFRAFSRKEKKDKKKSDDSLSLKSDISLDEGVILKRLAPLDGGTITSDAAAADKTEGGGEKKRRSMWRSLMGKKLT